MTYFSLHKTPLKRRSLALSLAFVITIGTIGDTTRVLAIPDEQFYSSNDILFYDPDASCGVATSDGLASLVGSVVPEQIWNFLVAKGLTNEQAAGVMGNIRAESGANFDPGAEELSGGGGYGIVQWTDPDPPKPGRRTALFAAAAKKGVPASDLAFQLEYLYQELTVRPTNRSEYKQFSNEWEMMQGQGTIEDALVAFHHEFEISHLMNRADPRAAVIQERLQYAKDAFASFAKNTPAAGSNTSECEAAPTGNLAQTITAYAWPDYQAGKTDKKPEYEAAVKKAKSEGRYTGDPCFGGGVDCGAFITILMADSGFEPGYNSNGKGGNTSNQMDWARANWQTVGRGGEVRVGGDPSDPKVLRQGDVALKDGHTYMYAGDIPGFNSKIASASQCDRAPMAGKESPTDNDFTWFRKK